MPEKIPEDKLPPADMNQMLTQMKAKDQKKKSKKKLRSISSSKSNGRDKSESKSVKRGKAKGKSSSKPREASSVSQVSSNARHRRKDDIEQLPIMSKTKSKQSEGSSTPLRTIKKETANFKDLNINVESFDKSPIPQS